MDHKKYFSIFTLSLFSLSLLCTMSASAAPQRRFSVLCLKALESQKRLCASSDTSTKLSVRKCKSASKVAGQLCSPKRLRCTNKDVPVCGNTLMQCNGGGCSESSDANFSNICEMKKAGAEFLYRGNCEVENKDGDDNGDDGQKDDTGDIMRPIDTIDIEELGCDAYGETPVCGLSSPCTSRFCLARASKIQWFENYCILLKSRSKYVPSSECASITPAPDCKDDSEAVCGKLCKPDPSGEGSDCTPTYSTYENRCALVEAGAKLVATASCKEKK